MDKEKMPPLGQQKKKQTNKQKQHFKTWYGETHKIEKKTIHRQRKKSAPGG